MDAKPRNAGVCVAAMQRETVRQKTSMPKNGYVRLNKPPNELVTRSILTLGYWIWRTTCIQHCPFNGTLSKRHYLKKGMGEKKIYLPWKSPRDSFDLAGHTQCEARHRRLPTLKKLFVSMSGDEGGHSCYLCSRTLSLERNHNLWDLEMPTKINFPDIWSSLGIVERSVSRQVRWIDPQRQCVGIEVTGPSYPGFHGGGLCFHNESLCGIERSRLRRPRSWHQLQRTFWAVVAVPQKLLGLGVRSVRACQL